MKDVGMGLKNALDRHKKEKRKSNIAKERKTISSIKLIGGLI